MEFQIQKHTSSTKLELQTLLWALGDIQALRCKVIVHTDSQNIIGLPGRRESLEKSEYRSKNNYELYEEFYRISDQIDFELVKLRGHQATRKKYEIDKILHLLIEHQGMR